jgi:hypothetical protein
MLRRALLALLVAILAAAPVTARASSLLSKAAWLADVDAAMDGSRAYVDRRVARAREGARLAVNLDIYNTSLATHYDRGAPVRRVLRFVAHARAQGVTLLFNSGRKAGGGRVAHARRVLERAGYDVGGICLRRAGEGLVHGKVRCRKRFVGQGFTLIANVGNRRSDFAGLRNYERAFDLPDYDGRLG